MEIHPGNAQAPSSRRYSVTDSRHNAGLRASLSVKQAQVHRLKGLPAGFAPRAAKVLIFQPASFPRPGFRGSHTRSHAWIPAGLWVLSYYLSVPLPSLSCPVNQPPVVAVNPHVRKRIRIDVRLIHSGRFTTRPSPSFYSTQGLQVRSYPQSASQGSSHIC